MVQFPARPGRLLLWGKSKLLGGLALMMIGIGANAAATTIPPMVGQSFNADHFEHNSKQQSLPIPRPAIRNPSSIQVQAMAVAGANLDCNQDAPNAYNLSGVALLDRLARYQASCLDSSSAFFALNANTFRLYADANMQTVAQAVIDRASQYTPTNTQSMRQLLVFLRTGYYVADYSNRALVHGSQTTAKNNEALIAFSGNPYFLDPSNDHGSLMYAYFLVADNDASRAMLAPKVFAYLGAMVGNSAYKNYGQYTALSGIASLLVRGAANSDANLKAYMNSQPTAWAELMAGVAINSASTLTENNGSNKWVTHDIVLAYSSLLAYASQKEAINNSLGAVLNAYPRLSSPWMAAVNNVNYYGGDCARYSICMEAVKSEVMSKAFPNTFTFDDGKVVMHTAVSQSKARQLYHAMKQVEAQYKRKSQEDTALPGDPNAVLKMYIYGSRDAYESFQYLLFQLGTNNGGIYVERDGTFYTYERTPQDSIYKLEELLRHEYVHYLSSRYAEHGMFGEALYSNERLTWFDEGSAEFFAGSTQADGVKVRKIMVSAIRNDGGNRMGVPEVLTATYASGFRFYAYAALFFNYLNERHPATLLRLFKALRANDIAAFDNTVSSLKNDSALHLEYTAYVDQQIANLRAMSDFKDGPVFDPNSFSVGDVAVIQSSIRNYLPDASCTKMYTALDARAGCSGTLTNGAFDTTLDNTISALLSTGVDNWETLVCSYGNVASNNTTPYYCEAGISANAGRGPTAGFVGRSGGNSRSFNLDATITPLKTDIGFMVNVYVAALLSDQRIYMRNGATWQAVTWTTPPPPLPVAFQMVATSAIDVLSICAGCDLHAIPGIEGARILVGYGWNDADMLNGGKYGAVYKVAAAVK